MHLNLIKMHRYMGGITVPKRCRLTLPDEEKKPARRGKAPVKRSQPEEVRYVEISDDDEGEAKKMELDEVEEAPQPPPTRARSTRSRSASVQPATRSQSRAGTQSSRAPRKAANQATPLFLLDSDEDEDVEMADETAAPKTNGM